MPTPVEPHIFVSQRVLIDGNVIPAAITTDNGIITTISDPAGLTPDQKTYTTDYGSALLGPGIIDAHIHINEPGRTEWEGFLTATKAAAAGGICTLADMPLNSSPVTVNTETLNQKLAAAEKSIYTDCLFWGGVTPESVDNIEEMAAAGVAGYKSFLIDSGIDEFQPMQGAALEKACAAIAKTGLPYLIHAEVPLPGFVPQPFTKSYIDFMRSRPPEMEKAAIKHMLQLCETYRFRLHIVHLAAAEALPLLRRAKRAGLPVTVETCPHYLYFAAEDIPDGSVIHKCCPPIRGRKNRELLWEAVTDGTIDTIGSDHSPAPEDLKNTAAGDLSNAWGGIASVQFILPVMLSAAKDRKIRPETLFRLMSEHPAALLGQPTKGAIRPGCNADFTVVTTDTDYTPQVSDIFYRHKLSPYIGERLTVKVTATVLNGREIYREGIFVTDTPTGKAVLLP